MKLSQLLGISGVFKSPNPSLFAICKPFLLPPIQFKIIKITTRYYKHSGGSTYGSAPLPNHSCVFLFIFWKIIIQKWKKCYRHKEWVLLSISIKFWEIATARTSRKRKLNPPTSFCIVRHVQLKRHRETIIVVLWCTCIQMQVRMNS